jgi:hypothetical protein
MLLWWSVAEELTGVRFALAGTPAPPERRGRPAAFPLGDTVWDTWQALRMFGFSSSADGALG